MRFTFLAAIVIFVSACVPVAEPDNPSSTSPLAADQSQPQLALVDHMLGTYFSSDVATRPTICASLHDGRSEVALPPGQERALMVRYDALAPFARCAHLDGAWQDMDTGAPALVFNLHSFTCASVGNCTGFGAYTAGNVSSASTLYAMEYTQGVWRFDADLRLVGEQ